MIIDGQGRELRSLVRGITCLEGYLYNAKIETGLENEAC